MAERQSTLLLTARRDKLASLETLIRRDIETFSRSWQSAGEHFRVIHDEELFRLKHQTFREYVRLEWNQSFQQVYKLIAASRVMEALKSPELTEEPSPNATLQTLPRTRFEASRLVPALKAGGPEAVRAAYKVSVEQTTPQPTRERCVCPTCGNRHVRSP